MAITNFMQKYASTEADSDKHTPSLSVKNIRAITSIRYTDLDMSEDAIPSEMIKVCIKSFGGKLSLVEIIQVTK